MPDRPDAIQQLLSPQPQPLGTEEQFVDILVRMSTDLSPAVFAVVETFDGTLMDDPRILAWGMSFENGAEVATVDGRIRGEFICVEDAHLIIGAGRTTQLVWPDLPATEEQLAFTDPLTRAVTRLGPKVFAIFEEAGERWDARIVAWGLSFESYVEVAFNDGRSRGRFTSAEEVRAAIGIMCKARLIWPDPERMLVED